MYSSPMLHLIDSLLRVTPCMFSGGVRLFDKSFMDQPVQWEYAKYTVGSNIAAKWYHAYNLQHMLTTIPFRLRHLLLLLISLYFYGCTSRYGFNVLLHGIIKRTIDSTWSHPNYMYPPGGLANITVNHSHNFLHAACTHTHTQAHMHTRTHTDTHAHTRTHTHRCIHTHTNTCTNVHTYSDRCAHTHYTHIRTRTYTGLRTGNQQHRLGSLVMH